MKATVTLCPVRDIQSIVMIESVLENVNSLEHAVMLARQCEGLYSSKSGVWLYVESVVIDASNFALYPNPLLSGACYDHIKTDEFKVERR